VKASVRTFSPNRTYTGMLFDAMRERKIVAVDRRHRDSCEAARNVFAPDQISDEGPRE
jgi:hypothetical protein